ncbi:threonine synthase [Halodesulfurarchaeum sp.]|uniref:threonine synthase n=1 Tax=Halodesulfurarchaeum sp. TaxID=1980530 RepID=UPI002FC2FBD9
MECRSCETVVDPEPIHGQCPECGGILTAIAEYDPPNAEVLESVPASMWNFDALLPFDRDSAVSMGEGATPLVQVPELASRFDIDQLLIKDEGQNPTGSIVDRELSMAMTAAVKLGEQTGSLAAPGAAGQSFAAYATRADLDGTVYLPARAPFRHKAMCNVHGIDLNVVQGRLAEAEKALQEGRDTDAGGYPFGAFETPFRYVGATTVAFEIVAAMDGDVPDAVVVSTGNGVPLVGLFEGFRLLAEHDFVPNLPRLVAVQPAGCAPIATAISSGEPPRPVSVPDTICGELEVADPSASPWIMDAIEETNGTAVSVTDKGILDAGVSVAQATGLELSPDAAAGPAGVQALCANGFFTGTETVLVLSTGTGGADLLKSHPGAGNR